MNSWGEFHIGDSLVHKKPSKHIHGNQRGDRTKGTLVRISVRPYGVSFFVKHEGRKAPIEWAAESWTKLTPTPAQ